MTYQQLTKILKDRLKPGQQIQVDRRELQNSIFHDLSGFTIADRALEDIVGSSYEYGYYEDPVSGNFVFYRLNEPLTDDTRTYVSPDRRHLFEKDYITGTWRRRKVL